MFDDLSPTQIGLVVFLVVYIIWIVGMVRKIFVMAKRNKARGQILDKMNSKILELAKLVFQIPETEEEEAERERRIAEVDKELEDLNRQFDSIE